MPRNKYGSRNFSQSAPRCSTRIQIVFALLDTGSRVRKPFSSNISCVLRGADDDLLCNWTSVKPSHDAGTPFKLIVSANFAPSPSLLSQAASHSTSHRKRLRQRTSVSSVTVSDSRCLTNAQSGGVVAWTSIQTATRHSAFQRDRMYRTNGCRIV